LQPVDIAVSRLPPVFIPTVAAVTVYYTVTYTDGAVYIVAGRVLYRRCNSRYSIHIFGFNYVDLVLHVTRSEKLLWPIFRRRPFLPFRLAFAFEDLRN